MTRYIFRDTSHPAAQAYRILHLGFMLAPLLAGLDKFFNLMVDWPKYLAPWIPNTLGLSPQTFMYGVGVIEIVAALLVAVMPRYGAYVVFAWLWGIIVNLVTGYGYYDIALRDFGLSLGALALWRLAQAHYAEQHMADDVDTAEVTTYREPRPLRPVTATEAVATTAATTETVEERRAA